MKNDRKTKTTHISPKPQGVLKRTSHELGSKNAHVSFSPAEAIKMIPSR